MKQIQASELIVNPDGSIFHLHLKPEDIADTIILVGDQGRVDMIGGYFDEIELTRQNREFRSITGTYKGKRLSVVSTGIGTDNIDIVLNELDALANIDLEKRVVKDTHTQLSFVRIGTSGALQKDIPVDTPVISEIACGFDGLLNFYADRDKISNLVMENSFLEHMNYYKKLAVPYFVGADPDLYSILKPGCTNGITISAPGFYGPQGRVLRLDIKDPDVNEKISDFKLNGHRFTNYEMESSAIYGLSKLLGHRAVTICNIIANRMRGEYSQDYKEGLKKTITNVLDRLSY
ncbi:MAG TPA: nucleoside phosphorylase [Salinivirga sp.]|uniref:nucleoside phosphorylase n=1 Tax=Salinivirga sp. TaxID=1970192 RepID=UPI002B47C53D|nr:nucleoside phosphorylase [Salinivirga sp.]HKK58440.1 nucleoside phosphorylase [Salinivirga sp.]